MANYGEPIKAIEMRDYIDGKIDYAFYVNEFPGTVGDDAAYIRMSPGLPASEWTTKKRPSFQVVVRGGERNMPQAEEVAYNIYELLHNRRNFKLSDAEVGDDYYLETGLELEEDPKSIVHCAADQSAPMYLGRDENSRPLYSLNFTMTVL